MFSAVTGWYGGNTEKMINKVEYIMADRLVTSPHLPNVHGPHEISFLPSRRNVRRKIDNTNEEW